MSNKKIALFQNIAPHYREALWKKLSKLQSFQFYFYFDSNSLSSIKSMPYEDLNWKHVNNIIIKNTILIWQKGVILNCINQKYKVAIFLGEMYCISTWIAALICRIRGIKVVFWGHGIYGNENKIKLLFRIIFYKLADQHLLYGKRAKEIMQNHGFDKNTLYLIYNSLDYFNLRKLRERYKHLGKYEVFPFFKYPEKPILFFSGRLTNSKKIDLLIKAANDINKNEIKVNLLIIGDGSSKNYLEEIGKKGLYKKWLHFYGACYNEKEVGKFLTLSDICISPGNVGLTAIHSLSYGTPVCTHNDFKNQGPEAESIKNGVNGFFFENNNLEDLKAKIIGWLSNSIDRNNLRNQCVQIIEEKYNPDNQLKVFNRLLNDEPPIE